MCVCVYEHVCVCARARTRARARVYVYVCVHVCMCVIPDDRICQHDRIRADARTAGASPSDHVTHQDRIQGLWGLLHLPA